ncbi:MAG: undecaprenyl-phosphate glucose phosphotransferase [Candidatus Eisenbacteria bacterium]|jgi:exopolysaccharide biosynthesis polyprenyl glycosylphosphotransferase|nr:undecaprenyl-phosphate glucose phosphotransferase [Candidatus Eisenbacteria bacterium]
MDSPAVRVGEIEAEERHEHRLPFHEGKPLAMQAVFPVVALLTDAAWIVVSFVIGYYVRFSLGILAPQAQYPTLQSYLPGLAGALIIWLVLLARSGLYQMGQTRCLGDQLAAVFKAGALSFLLFLAAAFFFGDQTYSRIVVAVTWMLTLVLLGLNRTTLLRGVSRWLTRQGIGITRIAVIGKGPHTAKILHNLTYRPPPGIVLLGTIGTGQMNCGDTEIADLGSLDHLGRLLSAHRVDRLIITIPFQHHQRILSVLRECARSRVSYDMVPDLFGMMTTGFQATDLGGVPLLVFRSRPIDGWGAVAKRVTDVVVASMMVVGLLPVLGLVALAILRDSGRPIFFGQKRVGLNNRLFTMYKFRSMRIDAEEASGPVWATPEDPRRTNIGRFLRQWNLDELPQLWNVLRGEMSLVGPRPERPFFVERFREQVPRYLERHKVRAGMTGWAQVNGLRGNTSIEERTRFDIYYVENWSLWFDLKVLFRTLSEWAKSKNAY